MSTLRPIPPMYFADSMRWVAIQNVGMPLAGIRGGGAEVALLVDYDGTKTPADLEPDQHSHQHRDQEDIEWEANSA